MLTDRRTSEQGGASAARAALADMFSENFDAVFAFCLMRSGSRQLAEEIASDVFADAVRHLVGNPTDEISRGWLIAVARRRMIDHWRKSERHRRRLEQLIQVRPPGSTGSLGTHEIDDARVLAALESLPPRQRMALLVRYLDELSVSEVAEVIDTSYTGAESVLARARRSFATAYEEGAS